MNQPTNKQIMDAARILNEADIPTEGRHYADEHGNVHKIVIKGRQYGKTQGLKQLDAFGGKSRFPTGSGRTCKSGR